MSFAAWQDARAIQAVGRVAAERPVWQVGEWRTKRCSGAKRLLPTYKGHVVRGMLADLVPTSLCWSTATRPTTRQARHA
jgi:hypothetical protein